MVHLVAVIIGVCQSSCVCVCLTKLLVALRYRIISHDSKEDSYEWKRWNSVLKNYCDIYPVQMKKSTITSVG